MRFKDKKIVIKEEYVKLKIPSRIEAVVKRSNYSGHIVVPTQWLGMTVLIKFGSKEVETIAKQFARVSAHIIVPKEWIGKTVTMRLKNVIEE